MQRLFIAIPLPQPLRRQLAQLRPKPAPKVRPVKIEQMHITVYFIGNADPALLVPALRQVTFNSFSIQLDGLGAFGNPARGGVLWVGCRPNEGIVRLHLRLKEQLSNQGVEVDERDFVPHVTLARCKAGTNSSLFNSYLTQALPTLEPFRVDRFVLFSSSLRPEGSYYRAEAEYLSQNAGPTAH